MSGRDDDHEEKNEQSFADLIGKTKPIARGPARVEKSAPLAKPPGPRVDDRRSSTFRWPDPEENRLAAREGVSDATLFALGRGEPEPEERIDLHGLRREAAIRLLQDRIESARARSLRCVIVIHGRGRHSETGESVLREGLPQWLSSPACAKHILGFAPAPNRLGGSGATLVLLRRA